MQRPANYKGAPMDAPQSRLPDCEPTRYLRLPSPPLGNRIGGAIFGARLGYLPP
jgi:hypothetical protein